MTRTMVSLAEGGRLALIAIITILMAGISGESSAQAPECGTEERPWVSFNRNECPAPGSCQVIDHRATAEESTRLHVTLQDRCDYDRVEFKIARSNVNFDCNGKTLNGWWQEAALGSGPLDPGPSTRYRQWRQGTGILVIDEEREGEEPVSWDRPLACGVDLPELEARCHGGGEHPLDSDNPDSPIIPRVVANITVRNCTIVGYEEGAAVMFGKGVSGMPTGTDTYLEWFHHPNERLCRMEQIDDCLRSRAPHYISFEDVHLRDNGKGLHLWDYVHDVRFSDGSIRDNDDAGVYMSTGTRKNTISGATISGNGLFGIALDSSAHNQIIGNEIAENYQRPWYARFLPDEFFFHYDVGITVFRNAWEGRNWENPEEGNGPRSQHSTGNVIESNEIKDQRTGVWVGYRQGYPYGCWYCLLSPRGDPIYYSREIGLFNDDVKYYRKHAEDTVLSNNTFIDVDKGIAVQDDGATISANRFIRRRPSWIQRQYERIFGTITSGVGVEVGHDVREGAGEPVRSTTVTDNLFSPRHTHAIEEQNCTLQNDIFSNNAARCTSYSDCDDSVRWSPVEPSQYSCNRRQARLRTHVARSDGTYEPGNIQSAAFYSGGQSWLVGDFNADGLDDVLNIYLTNDDRIRLRIHRAVERDDDVGSRYRFEYQSSFQTLEPELVASSLLGRKQWVLGNFDGKGGDDLVYIYGAPDTDGMGTYMRGFVAYGVGFNPANDNTSTFLSSSHRLSQRWMAGDVNGDGRDDLVLVDSDIDRGANVDIYLSVEAATAPVEPPAHRLSFQQTSTQPIGVDRGHWMLGDFDGDGDADLVNIFPNQFGQATIRMHRSTGSSFEPLSWEQTFNDGEGNPAGFWTGQKWVVADFDGDGRDDLMLIYGRQGEARVWRNRSTTAGLVHVAIQSLGEFREDQRWIAGRFDEDSRDDLLLVFGETMQ